jgi:branched-chain amino acid transport system permease protein
MIQQIIMLTLVRGSTYAIIASGLALIYGVGRIVNLAHTAFLMLAAYLISFLAVSSGWPLAPSILLAVVSTGVLGMLFYRFIVDPVREHDAAVLLITIAVAMGIQQLMPLLFGSLPRPVPLILEGAWPILGLPVPKQYVLTLGIAIGFLALLWLLLSRTKMGVGIRAVAQDPEVASLMGINVSTVLMIAVGIGTAMAAVAGALVPALEGGSVTQYTWLFQLLMVLVVVILGGLGSLKGSFIASFFVAFVQALVSSVLPHQAYLSYAFAMLAMVIVLSVRPQGMFGTMFEEERL